MLHAGPAGAQGDDDQGVLGADSDARVAPAVDPLGCVPAGRTRRHHVTSAGVPCSVKQHRDRGGLGERAPRPLAGGVGCEGNQLVARARVPHRQNHLAAGTRCPERQDTQAGQQPVPARAEDRRHQAVRPGRAAGWTAWCGCANAVCPHVLEDAGSRSRGAGAIGPAQSAERHSMSGGTGRRCRRRVAGLLGTTQAERRRGTPSVRGRLGKQARLPPLHSMWVGRSRAGVARRPVRNMWRCAYAGLRSLLQDQSVTPGMSVPCSRIQSWWRRRASAMA